jgi:hypothetical protein
MRDDQLVRVVAAVVIGAAYIARLFTVGNGSVLLFGYATHPLVIVVAAEIMLALPETAAEAVHKFPLGPTRDK